MGDSAMPAGYSSSPAFVPARRPLHLHVSDGSGPDLHLLDASGSCSLHTKCGIGTLPPAVVLGVRVVVAFDDVQIVGLADALEENDVCFAIGNPLKMSEIRGNAAALTFEASLLPPVPDAMPKGLVRVTGQAFSDYLTGLIGQVVNTPELTPPSGTRAMARALLSVLSSIFIEESARANLAITRSRSEDIYLSALAAIREQISVSELSPTDIAQACSVSPRYLHMLFQRRGETVSNRILHERLERCRADLTDATLADVPISEIAARWGFNTPSHFAQKFRSTYGLTPREWRARALTTQ